MALFIPKTKNTPVLLTGLLLTLVLLSVSMLAPKYLLLATDHQMAASYQFLISRIFFWLILFIIYLYAAQIEKQRFLLWEEKSYTLIFYIVSVFLLLMVIVLGSIIIIQFLNYFGWFKLSGKEQVLKHFSTPLKLLAVITAAFTEELIFRGYLLSRLQLFFKSIHWPVIISAVIFGLGHLSYGTIANALVPFFIGLVFAYHYQKYRNIKILIICHFLIDFYGLLIQ